MNCTCINIYSLQERCIECKLCNIIINKYVDRSIQRLSHRWEYLVLSGFIAALWHLGPPLPPSHLFAPVKVKKRQPLDERTFDLSEAPLLLLLSFSYHRPPAFCWGAVRVLKPWSALCCLIQPVSGLFYPHAPMLHEGLESKKDQSLFSAKEPPPPSTQPCS